MDSGLFNFILDQGLGVQAGFGLVTLGDEREWSGFVHPGTKVVMNVFLPSMVEAPSREYQCPRCYSWNKPDMMHGGHSAVDWYVKLLIYFTGHT